MAQQAKVVKVGPGGRNNGPRPKVENPGKVFKRILAYVMSRYKAQVIVVLCCILLAVFAQLQGVMFSQTLIDGYILPLLNSGSTDFSGLAAAIARVAAFYCVGICAVFVQNRLMAKITQGTLKDLRDEMFTHMQTLPIKYFDTHAHGDIMSVYTNDIDTLRQMISQSLPQLVNTIVTIIGVLFSMIYLSIPLTLLALAMVGVMLLATKYLTGNSGKFFIKVLFNILRILIFCHYALFLSYRIKRRAVKILRQNRYVFPSGSFFSVSCVPLSRLCANTRSAETTFL